MTNLIGRTLLIVLVLLTIFGLGWSLIQVENVLKILGLAALAAYLVNPLVKRLQSRGMNRTMAILAIFLALLTVLSGTSYLLVPMAKRQAIQIFGQLQAFIDSSDAGLARLQTTLEAQLPEGLMEDADLKTRFSTWLEDFAQEAVRTVTRLLLSIASNLVYVFLLPMFVFLILQDGPGFYRRLVQATPNTYFEVVHRLLHRIDMQLGSYMRGVLVVAFCVATVATVGLKLCGMKYFFVIGPLMGILNIIPIFGPLVGTGLAAVAMVLQTGELGSVLGPVIVGSLAQILDNIAFTPIAVSRSVNLHPLLVLVATLCGNALFGTLGLLLAVPVVTIIKVIWQSVQEVRHVVDYN
jgi:predicted PurR-regulated permease PerM